MNGVFQKTYSSFHRANPICSISSNVSFRSLIKFASFESLKNNCLVAIVNESMS